MSYDAGKYSLVCFDGLGRRDRRFEIQGNTFSAVKETGESLVVSGDIDSFVVNRCLYNSKQPGQARWEPKQ